jgi:hypothetical protein
VRRPQSIAKLCVYLDLVRGSLMALA